MPARVIRFISCIRNTNFISQCYISFKSFQSIPKFLGLQLPSQTSSVLMRIRNFKPSPFSLPYSYYFKSCKRTFTINSFNNEFDIIFREKHTYSRSNDSNFYSHYNKCISLLQLAGIWPILFLALFMIQQTYADTKMSSPLNKQEELVNILRISFPEIALAGLTFIPLEGGRSQSETFKFEINDNWYVIRLNHSEDSTKNQRELYMLQEASQRGFAPYVHYASSDASIILMDYVHGRTSTSEQAKKPENIANLAVTLRQVHDLPVNPNAQISVFKRMQKLYRSMKEKIITNPELDAAVEQLSSLKRDLDLFAIPCSTSHGDLNPCNILFTDQGIMLIDWSENGCEDPFYDLSCFALCHNYHANEEELLLTHYLGKIPDSNQRARYELNKRMDYVYFAIELFSIAHEAACRQGIKLKQNTHPGDWSFYTTNFEQKSNVLSPQFFYDFAGCALKNFHAYR